MCGKRDAQAVCEVSDEQQECDEQGACVKREEGDCGPRGEKGGKRDVVEQEEVMS